MYGKCKRVAFRLDYMANVREPIENDSRLVYMLKMNGWYPSVKISASKFRKILNKKFRR